MSNLYLKNQSGSTAVEFSLIAIVFLTIVFGIMESGRIFWTQNALQYAVENASRAALVDSTLSDAEIEDVATDSLTDMMISAVGFDVSVATVTIGALDYIEVDATYQYTAMVAGLLPASLNGFELEASARRPLVWVEE